MAQNPKIKLPSEIKRGDIIETPISSTMGLVYSIMKDAEGEVSAFEIIPLHTKPKKFSAPKNDKYVMIPNAVKKEWGLSPENNYQLMHSTQHLPVYDSAKEIARYASTQRGLFGSHILLDMDKRIYRERHPEAYQQEEKKIVFHNKTASFILAARKPSAVDREVRNIAVEDALKLNLVCKSIRDILTYGSYNGKTVSLIRDAWELSVEKNKTPIKSIYNSGIQNSDITIAEACDVGLLIRGKSSPTVWERKGITKLSDAMNAIASNNNVLEKINPRVIQHLEEYPITHGLPNILKSAFDNFQELVKTDSAKLEDLGIPYLHKYTRG